MCVNKFVAPFKMSKLQFVEVVDATSKDDRYPPDSLIRKYAGKWQCKKGEANHLISATFRLSEPTVIGRVDLGNCGSASVSVLVSRTDCKEFQELVPSQNFRTEAECRNGSNTSGVRMVTCGQMRQETRHGKWDLVRVMCYQPYRCSKEEQYGLSFLNVFTLASPPSSVNSVEKFKESALRSSSPARKELNFTGTLTRAHRMVLASKPTNNSPAQSDPFSDDTFKATVISLLDANTQIINSKSPSDAKSELIQKLQSILERKLTLPESRLFSQIFLSHATVLKEKATSGILKPRTSNSQVFTTSGCKKMEDTKMSLLKPQMNDSFNTFNTQTVYWAEVVHNHNMKDGPVSYLGRSGKENTPYLLEKNGLTNGETIHDDSHGPIVSTEKKMCLDHGQREKFSPSWKTRNDIDRCDSRDCSPDTLLKRKSDPSERCQPTNKKRPRDNTPVEENDGDSVRTNRITPSGGWLLSGSGLHKKKLSPPEPKKQDTMKFPFRVSPPPPPDRPASPLPLVDDIDQPSTSSRETVAERNIRLDMERRLAERSPPERVVQRTSAGKVKGPFCTKGMNTNDSPLRRLSICDENEEFGSPQARRKLSFVAPNGLDGDSGELVECPVCKCFYESCEINKHLDECAPSPIKRPGPDDGENEDEMACPICGLWQPKDTVAAHADECAQKRYGA